MSRIHPEYPGAHLSDCWTVGDVRFRKEPDEEEEEEEEEEDEKDDGDGEEGDEDDDQESGYSV